MSPEDRSLLEGALGYIIHVGANHTMRGQPHPQQWIVDGLTKILRASQSEAVDEWMPLSKQRPSPHLQVLFTDGELYSTGYMDPQGFFCMDINHESDPPMSPTHWMPCPTAPEEKE